MKNFNKEQEFTLCLTYFKETISFYKKIRQEVPVKKNVLTETVSLIKSQKEINVSIPHYEDNKKNVLAILKENQNIIYLLPKISTSMILNLSYNDLDKLLLFIPVNQLSFDIINHYLSLLSKLHTSVNIHQLNLGVINYFKLNKLTPEQEKSVLEYFSKIEFNHNKKTALLFSTNEYGSVKFSDNFWNELFLLKRHASGFMDLFKLFPIPKGFKTLCIEKDPIRLIKEFPDIITFDDFIEMLEKSRSSSSSFQRQLIKKIPHLSKDKTYKLDEAINSLSKKRTLLNTL